MSAAPHLGHDLETRRDLGRRGLLLAGAGLAAVAAPAVAGAQRAFGQATEDTSDSDAEILVGLIGFEQQMAVAYETALTAGVLTDAAPAAEYILGQEITHAKTLTGELTRIGGKPLPKPLPDDIPGLTEAKSRADYLDTFVRLENQLLAAYLEGQRLLGDAEILRKAAQICAAEGQHLVVIRRILGTDLLPAALPFGIEQG